MQPTPVAEFADAGSITQQIPTVRVNRTQRSLGQRLQTGLRVEHLFYGGIFLIAVLTRFWDLGSRALHHDESLHSYFSWVYASGNGYIHDPLMHGPFLFHATALMYLLFGATNAASRIAPALLGVIVVMLPWFLRSEKLLGRWGAISASALLLISPSILYYSRFNRHDIYAATGAFLLFIAIARYIEHPSPRWAIFGGLSIGYLLTTKEVSFIVLFVFVIFLGVAIALRVAPSLLAVGAAAVVAFLLMTKLLHSLGVQPLPGIPWSQPTGRQIEHFIVQLIEHPIVISGIGILLLALVVSLWLIDRRRPKDLGWVDGVLGDAPAGSSAAALHELLHERRALLIGTGAALAFFTIFYTSLFTNMGGLASGTFGALGYWLGQQGVQRGQEPWFYYLLLLPQYEFVAVLLFPVASAAVAWRVLQRMRGKLTLDSRTFTRGFLLFWALGMLAVLSWAGEKMPWNVIHIALPMTLLAACLIGDAIVFAERHWSTWPRKIRTDTLLIGSAVALMLATAYLSLAWASDGPYRLVNNAYVHDLRNGAANHWWAYVYLPWLLLGAVVLLGIIRIGTRRALSVTLIAGVVAFSLAQIHAEWRLTYREGDIPRDMLVYVQTTPDVPMVTQQLQQLSQQVTNGMGLSVWYDDVTQWPFNWYLKDFTNRRYIARSLPTPLNAQVIIISTDVLTSQMKTELSANYTYQEYPMRWWFPEEDTYRRFAYAPDIKQESRQNYQDNRKPPFTLLDVAHSVWNSIWSMRHPSEQGKIFRMVAYREVPSGFGSVHFRVYVRNDLLPYFNQIRY